MRILCLVDWPAPNRDASQEQTVNTLAALARAGAEVTLLAPRRAGDPAFDAAALKGAFAVAGGEFDVVQRASPWAGSMIAASALWLRRALADPLVAGADVVLTRMPAALILGPAGRPLAFEHYRPWPDQLPLLKAAFRRTLAGDDCLGAIVHSEFAAQSYRRLPAPADKILVAHNGFDPGRLGHDPGKAEARRRLGLEPDRPLVVYTGRINARKGLGQVLRLAELRPDTVFMLVGSEGEGPIERAARRLANVRIEGWRRPDELPDFLHAADVLLIPPSREPLERFGNCVLPLKTFQYLAAGRPILAPAAPDTAELLVDGRTALLVPPDRPEAAAQALDRLAGDPALAQGLADGARALAAGLSWDHRGRRILDFLAGRLAARKAQASR